MESKCLLFSLTILTQCVSLSLFNLCFSASFFLYFGPFSYHKLFRLSLLSIIYFYSHLLSLYFTLNYIPLSLVSHVQLNISFALFSFSKTHAFASLDIITYFLLFIAPKIWYISFYFMLKKSEKEKCADILFM